MRTPRSSAPWARPGITSRGRCPSPDQKTGMIAPYGARPMAFVFPGQGSQYVGMGKALYEVSETARRVFKGADDILGFRLSRLCFEGPEHELNDTINDQTDILTVSIACLNVISERWQAWGTEQACRYVAVHSRG